MEALRFDAASRVVRSVGDTPGVVVGLTTGEGIGHPNGIFLKVDPGGDHPYKLLDAVGLAQCADDAVALFALGHVVAKAFVYEAGLLAAAGAYLALSRQAQAHEAFSERMTAWAVKAFTLADVNAAGVEIEQTLGMDVDLGPSPASPMEAATAPLEALGVVIPDDLGDLDGQDTQEAPAVEPPRQEPYPDFPYEPAPARRPRRWWRR